MRTPTHIARHGVFVSTKDNKEVNVQTEVTGWQGHDVSIKACVLDAEGKVVGTTEGRMPKYTHQTSTEGSESVSWNDIQVGQTSLLSHWNFPAGSKQRVYVFTNAPQAELFLNGKSLGTKANDGKGNMQHVITWDVDYLPGILLAIARDAAGKETARHELQTTGKAVAPLVS